MRTFNYSAIKNQKWDSDILGLIAAIYKEAGKQELYLKQRPEELEKLVEIAKIQSTEHPTPSKVLSQRIRESGSLLKKRRHQRIVTNRKSLDIGMFLRSFMKTSIPFLSQKTISYNFIKSSTAI